MFAALLTHEARLQHRALLGYVGAGVLLVVGGVVLMLLRLPLLSGLGAPLAFGGVGVVALSVPIHLLQRYYASLYGREGYLTMALPVRAGTLFGAKFTWAFVTWLAALVVALVLGFGIALSTAVVDGGTVAEFGAGLREAIATLGARTLVLFAAWIVIGVAITVAQFGWIVTFGMEERFRPLGLGGPVLVWFANYVALQVLMLIAIFVIPLGATLDLSAFVFQSFATELPAALRNENPSFIPLGWLPVLLATLPAYWIWAVHSLKNHTSLR